LKVARGKSVSDTEKLVVFVLKYGFAMKNLFSLLGDDLRDSGAPSFEVIHDVLRLVHLGPVPEHGESDPVAKGVADTMSSHRIFAIVDHDLLGLEFYFAVGDLRFAIEPDQLTVNTDPDRISGSIVDSGFY